MQIILAPLFILFAPFIYFIKFYQVPIGHIEFFYLVATFVSISLISSLLLWRADWIRVTMVLTFLMIVSLSFLPEFQNAIYLKLAFFTLIGLAIWLQEKILPAYTWMAGIFCLSLLLFPVGKQFNQVMISQKSPIHVPSSLQTKTAHNSKLPLVIHIVFDEHMGVDAMQTHLGSGVQLQELIKSFYPHYGFRLFTHAYSRYSRTYDSIPNLLNFTLETQDAYYFPHGLSNLILKQNKDFSLLSDEGYNIRVIQPAYIDFCHAAHVNYTSC
ncbi:MAG: hypothetical protein ACK4PR_03865, partial [Gammaproteobacteria bacterium]